MRDLISRQDAVNIVDSIRDCISVDGYWALMERLKNLPSSQPASELLEDGTLCITVDDSVKVKRVLVQDNDNWGGLFYPDTQPDYDLDGYLSQLRKNAYAWSYYERGKSDAIRKGRWILQEDKSKKHYGWHICSECGAWIGEPSNFCSECGADMREKKEMS